MGQDATPFQAEIAAILDCVISCPRKRPAKEQITIGTDSQAAVADLAASGTKALPVADCTEKLTVLSEINQVTIMWVPGQSGIQQNETADRLAREGARTGSIGPEPFLPLSLSRFKSKIRNWIEKRGPIEWKACEKYWTSQLCLEGPTERYVQFISKLDRKHGKMLIRLLIGHINLQYILHKMRREMIFGVLFCAEKDLLLRMETTAQCYLWL